MEHTTPSCSAPDHGGDGDGGGEGTPNGIKVLFSPADMLARPLLRPLDLETRAALVCSASARTLQVLAFIPTRPASFHRDLPT